MEGGFRGRDDAVASNGPSYPQSRRKAEQASIQVNGLPIVTDKEPDAGDWYRANVPANGGFVVVADGFEAFERAMIQKLSQEITSAGPLPPGDAPLGRL